MSLSSPLWNFKGPSLNNGWIIQKLLKNKPNHTKRSNQTKVKHSVSLFSFDIEGGSFNCKLFQRKTNVLEQNFN